jgi:glycosyltransferase involved in cell wall biosynthesis
MSIALSYAIMTHNELVEFGWLMDTLRPFLNEHCEIVVLDDFSTPEMVDRIKKEPVRFDQRALNKNFSAQRNHLKNLCRGDFIFHLDTDELPSRELLEELPFLLEGLRRENIDACAVPRLNLFVEGGQPVDARALALSDADLLNRERDDQIRIIRNRRHLVWTNHVHMRLVGIARACRFPQELRYALLHCKTQQRYETQSRFYRSFASRHVDKLRKSILKRLGLIKQPEWVDFATLRQDRKPC